VTAQQHAKAAAEALDIAAELGQKSSDERASGWVQIAQGHALTAIALALTSPRVAFPSAELAKDEPKRHRVVSIEGRDHVLNPGCDADLYLDCVRSGDHRWVGNGVPEQDFMEPSFCAHCNYKPGWRSGADGDARDTPSHA
jgi:hypothetical protein